MKIGRQYPNQWKRNRWIELEIVALQYEVYKGENGSIQDKVVDDDCTLMKCAILKYDPYK